MSFLAEIHSSYTSEELALIFRHERIHIGREDSWYKFFHSKKKPSGASAIGSCGLGCVE